MLVLRAAKIPSFLVLGSAGVCYLEVQGACHFLRKRTYRPAITGTARFKKPIYIYIYIYYSHGYSVDDK